MQLTRLKVRNFKRLQEVDIELGDVVVFIGPNNSGKTSALQALTLWSAGVMEWASQRKTGVPGKRPGITMSRLGLTQIPVRETRQLWRNLHVGEAAKDNGEKRSNPVFLDVTVSGEQGLKPWVCGLEFYYANPESFYCRPLRTAKGSDARMPVPDEARNVRVTHLPPLSGLLPEEPELKFGRVSVLLGQGRSGEVLRNICLSVREGAPERWEEVRRGIRNMFGVDLREPVRDVARGVIELTYVEHGVELDIANAGRGLQQVLLLLAHMNGNPNAVLLLDEPDAHLEVLRQKEVYGFITDMARKSGNQLLIASHSEVVLQEATDRDLVISFVGPHPRRVDDRGSQVLKALRSIRAEDYYQADRKGFVLYLEGSTDLAILRSVSKLIGHPASAVLDAPFSVYVGNVPRHAQDHFYGLRAAKPDLRAFALFDRLERPIPDDFAIPGHVWRRREIENYLASRKTLLAFATVEQRLQGEDDLIARMEADKRLDAMKAAVTEIETALRVLRKDAWSPDVKVSDDVLGPLFTNFYERLGIDNRLRKSDYHLLVDAMTIQDVPEEMIEVLGKITQASAA